MNSKDLDQLLPVPDLLAEIETPSKPASAWDDELKRAAANGRYAFIRLNGSKRGRRYTTRRDFNAYRARVYRTPNTDTAAAVKEALNRPRG